MKLSWDSLLTRCLRKLQPAYQETFSQTKAYCDEKELLPN